MITRTFYKWEATVEVLKPNGERELHEISDVSMKNVSEHDVMRMSVEKFYGKGVSIKLASYRASMEMRGMSFQTFMEHSEVIKLTEKEK